MTLKAKPKMNAFFTYNGFQLRWLGTKLCIPHHSAVLNIHLLCWCQQSCTSTAFLFLLYVNLQKNERGAIRLFAKSSQGMNCVYPDEACFIKTLKKAGALQVLLKNSDGYGRDATSEALSCARCCRGYQTNLSYAMKLTEKRDSFLKTHTVILPLLG